MQKFDQFKLFLSTLWHNYDDDRCLRSASSLTFTTLLSLVPLTAVIFSIFTAFPVFQNLTDELRNFVFSNFVPASGEVVKEHLEEFTSKASQLTAIGILFLVISALMLMSTIEGAINDVWYITTPRRPLPRFLVYWASLTLGPLLVGSGIAISSYIVSLPIFESTAIISGLKVYLLALLPFTMSTIACTLLFAVVPNTYVPLRNAFIGALVSALLFEVAKKGFAYYVTTFPTYELVYGALASVPVFLLWIYISWMVVLLGAEITYTLSHPAPKQTQSDTETSFETKLINDAETLHAIWQHQQTGHLPTNLELSSTPQSLQRLQHAGLIHLSEEQSWALSKTAENISLAELVRLAGTIQYSLTLPTELSSTPEREHLLKYLDKTLKLNSDDLNIPVIQLMHEPTPAE